MLDRYIVVKDKTIVAKQTSSGRWICDSLPADTTKELDLLIGEVNRILNKYNTDTTVVKHREPDVRGVKI